MYAYTISWMMSAYQDVLLSWFRLGDSFVYMLIVFDGQNKQASDMPFLWANTGFSSKTLITVRKIPENIHNNRACNFRGSLNFDVWVFRGQSCFRRSTVSSWSQDNGLLRKFVSFYFVDKNFSLTDCKLHEDLSVTVSYNVTKVSTINLVNLIWTFMIHWSVQRVQIPDFPCISPIP